jgi:hypothetical protein
VRRGNDDGDSTYLSGERSRRNGDLDLVLKVEESPWRQTWRKKHTSFCLVSVSEFATS